MQYLGSISRGFALATALFGYSSELEGTNTDLQKLSPPQSPLKAFRAGRPAPGGGEGHARGAKRLPSWEPLGSSSFTVQ